MKYVQIPTRHAVFFKMMFVVFTFVLCLNSGVSVRAEQSAGWWSEAAKPYQGTVLRGISEDTPASQYIARVLVKKFELETGIKVEFETVFWDDMYDKSIKDMATKAGLYDFVYVEQDILSVYLMQNYLVNLSLMLKDTPELASPYFSFQRFNSFLNYFREPETSDIYGVPVEAFLKVYAYRRDLFDEPDIQNAFHEAYGYPLAPATTFVQYRDIAEFFTNWGRQHQMPLWGTTLQASIEHSASFYEFFETIAPSFGVYNWGINMHTWTASVENGGALNSNRAKEALTFWVNLLPFSPPGATGSTWYEVAAAFAAGQAAQGWIYGENIVWIATDPRRSQVVGKMGVALPPLYEGVLEDANAGRGYIGYYDGGAFGIPSSSRQKEASLLWLQYLGQESVQRDWSVQASRIVQNSVLDDPQIQSYDHKSGGYFSFFRNYSRLFAGAPYFPFHASMRDMVAPYIHQVIQGRMTPGDALDEAATRVDQLLSRLKKKGVL